MLFENLIIILSVKKRILLADENHAVLEEQLTAAGLECDALWHLSTDELKSKLPEYDGLVIRSKFQLTETILKAATHLKCIGRVGAGMENIDVKIASELGITCVSAPEGNRDAVGEHALGMLLMLLNRLKIADAEVRNGVWLRAENRGVELNALTVGIIGYGHMGSAFAQKLKGFGCKILAFDKYKTNFGNEFVTESSLQTLYENADVISLHVPLTDETNYMVNAEFLNQFKKPIYIINTARGKCINTSDLIVAIEAKKVLGACLDVLEYETSSFEKLEASNLPKPFQYLINSDKVILTPHIAGWTHDSNYKMSKLIAERMIEVLSYAQF
jgi:D-3-phosphoglycerate dehydrogenase / 2-oxoglutarate reductase